MKCNVNPYWVSDLRLSCRVHAAYKQNGHKHWGQFALDQSGVIFTTLSLKSVLLGISTNYFYIVKMLAKRSRGKIGREYGMDLYTPWPKYVRSSRAVVNCAFVAGWHKDGVWTLGKYV